MTKFVFGVFQGKILFLNIILRLNFTGEAEIVTLTRSNYQLPSLFKSFKIWHKNTKIVIFYSLIHWLVYANVIIHLIVGEKPSISTSLHSRLGEYPGLFTSTSVNNCSFVRDSEPIRLLEIPTSPSLYMLINNSTNARWI